MRYIVHNYFPGSRGFRARDEEAWKRIAERDADEASDNLDIGDLDGLDSIFSKKS